MSVADFQFLEKLGQGAYSTVYKVCRKADRQIYALKKVKISPLNDKEKRNSLNQVRLLASITHPNILQYRDAFLDTPSNSLCIVTEFMDAGDLLNLINQKHANNHFISEEVIWSMITQLVKALHQLHRHNILHRDLKSANVFLKSDGTLKLGDMNVSKLAQGCLLHTQTGTPYYASPQIWKEKPYDSKSDIWSLGCVIFQMCALRLPFKAQQMEVLYKKIIKGQIPKIPAQYSQRLYEFIETLIRVKPSDRPSCDKILQYLGCKPLPDQHKSSKTAMMKTINYSSNWLSLASKLPRSNYEQIQLQGERSTSLPSLMIHEQSKIQQTRPQLKKRLKKQIYRIYGPKHQDKSAKEKSKSKNKLVLPVI